MSTIQNPTSYLVTSENDLPVPGITGKDLVLAWARDIKTKEPRYIGEHRKEQTGQKCRGERYNLAIAVSVQIPQ